jgi:hypothetical protein
MTKSMRQWAEELEPNIQLLNTTTDFRAGEEALAELDKSLPALSKQLIWPRYASWAFLLASVGGAWALAGDWPFELAALLFLPAIAFFIYMTIGAPGENLLRRAGGAKNRWQQIAGTLAVQDSPRQK